MCVIDVKRTVERSVAVDIVLVGILGIADDSAAERHVQDVAGQIRLEDDASAELVAEVARLVVRRGEDVVVVADLFFDGGEDEIGPGADADGLDMAAIDVIHALGAELLDVVVITQAFAPGYRFR